MTAAEARLQIETVTAALTAALKLAWQVCDLLDDGPVAVEGRPGGVRVGVNLPDLLSVALRELAGELGGTERLVEHRPGSWEAEHVRALGYLL